MVEISYLLTVSVEEVPLASLPAVYWHHIFIGIVVYLAVKELIKRRKSPVGPWFKAVMAAHNALLCLYSAWTFYYASQIVYAYRSKSYQVPFYMTHTNMAYLGYVFYLSKYYEFFDTWILCLRKQPESWLQVYHHIGALIAMGWLTKSRSDPAWTFVTFNSLVHTIMYCYYFLCVVKIRMFEPLLRVIKPWITRLQLLQFFTGITLSFPYFFNPEFKGQMRLALGFTQVYTYYLVYLFIQFYRSAYLKKLKKGT